jgi:translocation and assembly module TamA
MKKRHAFGSLIAGLGLMLWIASVQAQTAARYTVDINGAGQAGKLFDDYLDINRHRDEALDEDELRRLVGVTPGQMRELLATEGYFSPSIQARLERQGDSWAARFDVEPGPQATVETVDIRFTGAIANGPQADVPRMERLRRRWSLAAGDAFRQAAWSGAKSALLKSLLNRDFPAAAISTSEARVDPQRNSVTLMVEVDSGPQFTFGELQVHGLERYSRERIDSLNPIQPGDAYSQEKLNELQSRLDDTGYFRSAFATVEVDPAHPERVPIRLDLSENQRKRLSLGVGFSTDTGARAQVKWLDRHFLQRDWRLESELRIDRETGLLAGDVFLPALQRGLPGWLPSFGTHFERTTSAGEVDDKLRGGARLASPDKQDEQAFALAYLADRQRIAGLPVNNRQALIASFTYTRRRVDNLISPRRGYVASVELGAGARGIVNQDNIVRVVTRGTWLLPLGPRWLSVLRGQVGQVFGGDRSTVPGDLLFRTGGDQSVRGYGYNTLGVPQNGAIVGGAVTAVASAELVYRVTPAWGAAVFTDAGNAADSWREFHFARGTGVGARWRSPIGPVNLDLAFGHETRKPRLHFSLGYGF